MREFTRENIEGFFNLLEIKYEERIFSDDEIFKVGETRMSVEELALSNHIRQKFYALEAKHKLGPSHPLTPRTCLICVSAIGVFLYLFPL